MVFTDEHIGRRVAYTGRNGNVRYGTIKDYAHNMANVALEGSTRAYFYVPLDTITLVDSDGVPQLK